MAAFWSSSKTLASKVLVCPETSFVLFYQKFDSMRVKRVHKNERKVREKKQKLQKTTFSVFFCLFCLFPTPTPLHLPSINPTWFLFSYMSLRISKEKIEGLWTGYRSLGMHIKQNFKLVLGFKNDTACSLDLIFRKAFTILWLHCIL